MSKSALEMHDAWKAWETVPWWHVRRWFAARRNFAEAHIAFYGPDSAWNR